MYSNVSLREPAPSPKGNSDLTVIIPTLNEVGSIAELLRALGESVPGLSVIVVDDSSSDGTPEAVRLAARQAERRGNSSIELLERQDAVRGITASVLDAVSRVRTSYFIVMDGDLQHPVDAVPGMFRHLAGGSDLVIAARASLPQEFGRARTAVSWSASRLASMRLRLRGISVKDPLSGFFGARTDFFREILQRTPASQFEPRGYKVLFDFLKGLPRATRRAGSLKLEQVDYHFGVRQRGESKLAPIHVWCFLRSLIS